MEKELFGIGYSSITYPLDCQYIIYIRYRTCTKYQPVIPPCPLKRNEYKTWGGIGRSQTSS